MDRTDIEANLLQALYTQGQYTRCVALSLELLTLPPVTSGGVTVLLFSLVDWTPSSASRKFVNSFGFNLTREGSLTLPARSNLFDEVRRVLMSFLTR